MPVRQKAGKPAGHRFPTMQTYANGRLGQDIGAVAPYISYISRTHLSFLTRGRPLVDKALRFMSIENTTRKRYSSPTKTLNSSSSKRSSKA